MGRQDAFQRALAVGLEVVALFALQLWAALIVGAIIGLIYWFLRGRNGWVGPCLLVAMALGSVVWRVTADEPKNPSLEDGFAAQNDRFDEIDAEIERLTELAEERPIEEADLATLRRQIALYISAVRAGAEVEPLQGSASLRKAADEWSTVMREQQELSHPDLVAQYGAAAEGWSSMAENVGYGATWDWVLNAFAHSRGHLANMTNPRFDEVGIGLAVDDEFIWVTLVFAGYP
jgi:hypothetical protein